MGERVGSEVGEGRGWRRGWVLCTCTYTFLTRPQTNMDIVQYSFVNWEQVKGESPESLLNPPHGKGTHSCMCTLSRRQLSAGCCEPQLFQ